MSARLNAMRTSLCSLDRGLYAFRYRSAPPGPAPLAELRVVSGPVTLVAAPGRTSARLAREGQTVVLVAEAHGVVEVSLRGGGVGGEQTTFSLELLDRGGDADAEPPPAARPEGGGVLLGVEAHVSRLGDVRAAPGAWIAGPDLPLPIEGLTLLEAGTSAGLELQVRSAANPDAWSPWAQAGQFAGTRQRAEHLTGVRVRLRGAQAAGHTIKAEALFLGASAVRQEGACVEFAGVDPLVGLKLDVTAGPPAAQGAAHGRVQVFRAR